VTDSAGDDEMNLDQPATRRDLREEIRELRADMERRFDDVRRHIDVSIEAFKSEFANLYDWTQLTTATLGGRIEAIESGHGGRLSALEHRMTRLETKRK
jgi:hypothetical protein